MDLQALVNNWNEADCKARGGYHLTLGGLLDALNEAPADALVCFADGDGADAFGSYRGYYTDIAISAGPRPTVEAFRARTETALETVFEGYKGGDYPASPDKPLWRSGYGEASGLAIVGARLGDDCLILETKQID